MILRLPAFVAYIALGGMLLGFPHPLQAQEIHRYQAPHVPDAPAIDGLAGPEWTAAKWDTLAYNYQPGTVLPQSTDLFARYKALWNAEAFYLLVEVVDDSLSDRYVDPLKNWWQDDCVEIFLDENRDGGDHQFNFKAWAYHVSSKGEVVDYGDDELPHRFDEHVRLRRTQVGDTSLWEMAVKVYDDAYALSGPNSPLSLAASKILGFSLAYCDNDGKGVRDNFVGSVNTPGHLNNEGYLDSDVFGELELLPGESASIRRRARAVGWERKADAFRVASGGEGRVRVRQLDGRPVRQAEARAGQWLGSDLVPGTYLVHLETMDGEADFVFVRP